MATVRQPLGRPASPAPPLRTRRGQPVSVVHLAAEYYPFARTGGLAEAVSGLAEFQRGRRAQRGRDPAAVPHGARRGAATSSRWGSPFMVPMGGHTEEARLFRVAGPRDRAPGLLHRAPGLLQPSGHLRRERDRLSRQRPALRVLCPRGAHGAASPRSRRRCCCTRTTGTRRSRWSTSAPSLGRTADRPRFHGALGAQRRYQGHFPPDVMPDIGLPWELYNWHAARVVRQGQLPQGRAGLRRRRDHGEPDPGAGAAHPGRRLRAAGRVHLAGRPVRRHPQRHRPARWDPATDPQITRAVLAPRTWRERSAARRRCSVFGLPQRRACRSSA